MKIIVSHSGKQHVHQLLNALLKDGHSVEFYTLFWYKPESLFWRVVIKTLPSRYSNKLYKILNKKYSKELETSNIKIKTYPFIEIWKQIIGKLQKNNTKAQFWADRSHDRWVAKNLKKQDYDIFIGYEMSSYESFKVVKSQGEKAILDLAQIHYKEIEELAQTHHSLSHLKENTFRKKLNLIKEEEYQLADKIITLSSFANQSMIKHGIPAEKLWIANLGYNEGIFKFKPKTLKRNNFNLIYTGAIIKRKGIIELRKALFEISAETNFKFTLTLVGGLIDRNIFDDVNFDVIYKPFMPHDKLVKEYHNADLYVFPSLLDSFAMVVLEAMGCGTPVIITENTGAKDAVLKYGGGDVIKAGNIPELKETLLGYFNTPKLILEKSEETKMISEHCTWESYYKNIQELIRTIETESHL